MSEKVYGICGTNKCRKEVIPKDGLKGMLPALYEFTVTTDESGNINSSQAAADPEITGNSVILAVNYCDRKTIAKELAPTNIKAILDIPNSRITLRCKGLVPNTTYWIDVVVVEIPKLGQSD